LCWPAQPNIKIDECANQDTPAHPKELADQETHQVIAQASTGCAAGVQHIWQLQHCMNKTDDAAL
jgi:hypothetical protein